MAQQETYGNWLGPKRLVRQPGIYSMATSTSPLSDFRPASPESFDDDDYDDVSMGGDEAPAKGVYLLAGPPSSSPAPKDLQDLNPKSENFTPKSENSDPKLENLDPKLGISDPKSRNFGPRFGICLVVTLLVLSVLGGAAIVVIGVDKYQELRAELELLRSNLSGLWDSAQQNQTRLQFGIHQHQQQLQELNTLLCRSLGVSRRCPPGWKSQGSSCFSFSREGLGWGSARRACADLGAELAVVSSQEEQLFLVQNRDGNGSRWLGLAEHGGTMRWVTGEEPKDLFWDVWGAERPRGREECGALSPRGRWERQDCARALPWICERPAEC